MKLPKNKNVPTKNKLDVYCEQNGHNPQVKRKEKVYEGANLVNVIEVVKCKQCYKEYERPFQG